MPAAQRSGWWASRLSTVNPPADPPMGTMRRGSHQPLAAAARDRRARRLLLPHDELRGRARAGTDRRDPFAGPRQAAVHALAQLATAAGVEVDEMQRPEAAFVAAERDAVAVRRPRVGALAE